MRRLIFLLLSLFASISCVHAQVGSLDWSFRSRADVIPALNKTRGNLRATYNVIICTARYGYQNTALGYYEKVVEGRDFDASAEDSAAYAFSYAISNGFRPWNWKKDSYRGSIKDSSQAKAAFFRERAFNLKPKSPEVLTMQAFAETMGGLRRKEAYKHMLYATKLAPKWADAYYWLGWSADYYALDIHGQDAENQKTKANLGRLMLNAYDKAEKLDPNLKPHLYLKRIGAYDLLPKQEAMKEVPKLIDAHFKAFPYYVDWCKKRNPNETEASIKKYLMP